jgi:hypothetical protein
MRDDRVNEAQSEKRFCTCEDLHPCTCINYPPYHCGVCGREYHAEQVSAAREKGWYTDSK